MMGMGGGYNGGDVWMLMLVGVNGGDVLMSGHGC